MLWSVPPEAMSIPSWGMACGQACADAGHVQGIKGALLQYPGALTLLAVVSRLLLDDQVLDPVDMQQVGQKQPRGSGPDD